MSETLQWHLWLDGDIGARHSYPLGEGEWLIGRSPDSHVCLEDPTVSWRHALVRVMPQRISIEDLRSTNGTFVDDVRVEEADLQSGQTIGIGQYRLTLGTGREPPSPDRSSEHTLLGALPTLDLPRPVAPPNALSVGTSPAGRWPSWIFDYRRAQLRGDLSAGFTVAFVMIPQGIAYAMLAGLPPIMGLYAAMLPMLVYALFGSSRHLSVGPVSLDSIIVAAGIGGLLGTSEGDYVRMAIVLALMVGAIQLSLGLLRMGFVVNFLSSPVLCGFTIAAAVIIIVSQIRPLLGLEGQGVSGFFAMLHTSALHLHTVHPVTSVIGLLSVAALYALKHWLPKWPGPMLLLIAGIAASAGLDLVSEGVVVVGEIPSGLPPLELPQIDLQTLQQLLPLALVLALVGFTEAISIAKSFAQRKGYSIQPNQELRAIGLSNLAAGVTHGYSVTGGFSRSAVNVKAGANTQLSAIIAVCLIALVVGLFTLPFRYLPVSILAAVILVSVGSLIDMQEARYLFRVKRSEGALLVFTLVATLILGITQGLLAGIAASVFLHMLLNTRPPTALLGRLPGTDIYRNVRQFPEAETFSGLRILRIDAAFYFANAEFIKQHVLSQIDAEGDTVRAVILDGSAINDLDSSADTALHFIAKALKARGVGLYIAGIKGPVREVMKRSGLYDVLGGGHFFFTIDAAVKRYQRGHTAIEPD